MSRKRCFTICLLSVCKILEKTPNNIRYTSNANSTPLLHVSLWCKPRRIGSVLSVKYMPNIPICNTNIHLQLGTTNIRSLCQVHDTRGAPKLHDKIYTLYTEFTHTPDLHIKLGTTNTHSLHQIHITRELHQFYTFFKRDFEKYTGNKRCFLTNFGVCSTYTIYTKTTRVIPEYVSAGYMSCTSYRSQNDSDAGALL